MKHLIATSALAIASSALTLTANALAIDEYNVFTAGDYIHVNASVGGKAFVGGDAYIDSTLVIGDRLSPSAALDTLVTVGDINAIAPGAHGGVHVQAGNVVHGGAINDVGFNMNGGGSIRQESQSALITKRDNMIAELNGASNSYSAMTANGNLVRNGNTATFDYTGAQGTAVFNVNAEDVFQQNTGLNLNAGLAETVIINISTQGSGYNFVSNGGINFTNGFSNPDGDSNNIGARNILWNFYDAESVDLMGLDTFRGSILAMGASVFGNPTTDGAIAVKSLYQTRQIHNYTFVPPSEVPLPASVQFMLMGMAALVGLRRWRKHKASAQA
ncbi:MAG TPA: choice-of-anchor A family protein [Marinagarivorans sp.]